jgi:serine phosphatase RsbU (regulator of sigma subunit)
LDSGFTTACCVRIRTSGHFTVANAGHIAPYLASAGSIGPIRTAETGSSHELETPPALPLGLAPDQHHDTIHGHLLPGQRLVLLSDGIPEARSHKGELYGFDRLTALTLKPAAEIARTAQTFGQEDDITVLTTAALSPTTNQPPPPPAPAPPRPAPPPPRVV